MAIFVVSDFNCIDDLLELIKKLLRNLGHPWKEEEHERMEKNELKKKKKYTKRTYP